MNNKIYKNLIDYQGNKLNLKISDNGIDVNCADNQKDCEIIDMTGFAVIPKLCDLHVHLRDPGFTHKEDIETGTRAALHGGVGTLVTMPNTNPVADTPETIKYIIEKANKYGFSKVLPCGCITKGQKSMELCDYSALKDAGAVAFSDDGRPVTDASLMRQALTEVKKVGLFIISHAEELSLAGGGCINAGEISKKLGVKGIPNSAEDICTARDIILAGETNSKIHIAHVSSAGSVEIIRKAKALGISVTAETCPHYFCFTDSLVESCGTNAKMNPPLRTEKDRLAIIEGLLDGTIDCISTDHAPHTEEEKSKGLENSPMGICGIETSFSASYTALVKSGILSLKKLTELMCFNPLKILSIDAKEYTTITENNFFFAEITTSYTITKDFFLSKGKNSPFIGKSLFGKIIYP